MFDAGAVSSIIDPGSKGFELVRENGSVKRFFIVHKSSEVFAYRNECPHTGANLEWQEHQFLDFDDSFIQCTIHGALFKVSNGLCLRGPCAGQSLKALPLKIDEGRIFVDVSTILIQEETTKLDF